MTTEPVTIEIVSDMVCPWCWIGKRRLDSALEQLPDIAVERVWRPYMLNPDMPAEGMDRDTYLAAKFGAERLPRLHEPLAEIGRQEGIPFDFHAIRKMPSSLDAHRLARWARSAGVQPAVIEDLFSRYFEKGEDISDPVVLLDVAEQAGMDAAIVAELLAGDQDSDLVRREDDLARRIGVTGVPTYVINQKWAVVGAQPAENWLEILRKVAAGEDLSAG